MRRDRAGRTKLSQDRLLFGSDRLTRWARAWLSRVFTPSERSKTRNQGIRMDNAQSNTCFLVYCWKWLPSARARPYWWWCMEGKARGLSAGLQNDTVWLTRYLSFEAANVKSSFRYADWRRSAVVYARQKFKAPVASKGIMKHITILTLSVVAASFGWG